MIYRGTGRPRNPRWPFVGQTRAVDFNLHASKMLSMPQVLGEDGYQTPLKGWMRDAQIHR